MPIAMIVGGYPSRQQEERRQTPRFAVEDIVHENGYDMEKAGRMMEMIEEKEDWHGENLTLRLKAFCKRKWNCSFSEEMSRSVKAMLDAWAGPESGKTGGRE